MKKERTVWLLLIASNPTAGATPRMRLWRAIKGLGCASLRDGAYLLPNGTSHASALTELAEQTNTEGGQAWVVDLSARSSDDEAAFTALFHRDGDYTEFVGRLSLARKTLAMQAPSEVAKVVKRLSKELNTLQRIDFSPMMHPCLPNPLGQISKKPPMLFYHRASRMPKIVGYQN